MCREICDGTGAGICDGAPSTCSSLLQVNFFTHFFPFKGPENRPFNIGDCSIQMAFKTGLNVS